MKVFDVLDGPDKPSLQWAVAHPERGQTVTFKLPETTVEASIAKMEETGAFDFDLEGKFETGELKDKAFAGHYSVETRSGSLKIQE
jgi:hypothetical protein